MFPLGIFSQSQPGGVKVVSRWRTSFLHFIGSAGWKNRDAVYCTATAPLSTPRAGIGNPVRAISWICRADCNAKLGLTDRPFPRAGSSQRRLTTSHMRCLEGFSCSPLASKHRVLFCTLPSFREEERERVFPKSYFPLNQNKATCFASLLFS